MAGAMARPAAPVATGVCSRRGLRARPAGYLAGRSGGSTLSRPALSRRPCRAFMEDYMANNKNPGPDECKAELLPASLAYLNPDFLNSPDGRILRILSEYAEPLARFRREKIQDTVVFFGSARFASLPEAQSALTILEKPGSAKPAPPQEQPGSTDGDALQAALKRAHAAVEMARYYEEARRLASMLTEWTLTLPGKRHR